MKRNYFNFLVFGIIGLVVLIAVFGVNHTYLTERQNNIQFEQSLLDIEIQKEIQQDILIEVFM